MLTAAVSSIAPSLGASNADDDGLPNSGPRRTLMMIVCSSTIRLERCSLVRPVW
jgi:hypothetical protein